MFLPNKNTNDKLYLFNNILPNDSSFNLYKKFVNSQKNLAKSFLNENSKKNIKNSNDFINQTSTTNSSHIPFQNNTILKETKRKKIFLNTNLNFNKNILENINYNNNKNNNNTLYINNYLNYLILKKNQNNNKNNNLNSIEKNEKSIIEFKNIFDNKSDVNNYLNYIKENYKNKENLNKLKKKVNNVYFNEILNNLYKKILYLDSKNNEITTDIIMNLLISEKNKIEKEFENKNIQLKLKNFSSVSINNNNKIFFPLINKYKIIEKEKIENKNILITENKKENFDLKTYLKRLDLNQQIELQKKFLNNMNKSENKNSIWELYDKLQNVKKEFSNEEFDPKLLSNPNFIKFIEDEYKNNLNENQNFNSEINNNIHKRNVNLDKTYFGTMYNNYNNNINNKNFISSKISLKKNKNNNLTNVGIANSTKDNSTFFNTNNNNINKLSVEIHDKKRKIQNVSENKNVKKNLSKSKSKSKNKNKNKKNKNINIINSDLNDIEQNIFVSDSNKNNINNNKNNNNNDDSFSLNDDFSINTIESNSNEEENENNNNNILNKNNNHLNKNDNLNNSNNNRKNSLLKNRNKLSLNTKSLIYLEIFDENNEEDLKLKEKVLNYKGIKFKDDKLAILIHKDGNAIERKIDKDNKIIYIIKDKDNNIINTIKIDNENVCYIDKDNKIVYDKNTLENIELLEHLFRKKELILKKLVIKKFGGLISKESYKGKYVYNKEKNKKLLEYYYKQLDNENINFNENNNNFNINKNKIKIKKEDIEKNRNENNNNNKINFYSPKINFSKFKNRKYAGGKFGKNNISKGKKNSINKSNMINNISNIDNEYRKEEENRNNYNKDIKKQNISSSSSSSSIVDTSKLSNLELFKYKACKIAGIPYVKKKKATQKLKILSENYDEINVTEEELKSRQELLKSNFQFLAEREGLKYITDDDIKNAKIKELKIFENIKYKIQNETTEEGKQMYLDLLEQINQLKNMDINSYILNLCKKHSPFQDEIDNIVNSKDIEIRLNSFIDKLNYDREKYKARRELLSNEIKIKDFMFKSQLNFKPINFYNK